MNIVDIAGAIGSFLFGTACAPMAWKTFKLGKGIGTPKATIWTFVAATLLFAVYLWGKVGLWQIPTITVLFEFVCWSLAAWYEYFPRPPKWGGFSSERVWKAYQAATVGLCTREPHHLGPCNGRPDWTCNVPYDMNAAAKDIVSVNRMYRPGDPCLHGYKDWDDCPLCGH